MPYILPVIIICALSILYSPSYVKLTKNLRKNEDLFRERDGGRRVSLRLGPFAPLEARFQKPAKEAGLRINCV